MLIIVLVRKELRAHISSISTASVGIGFLNTLGNKGGVALRIQIYDTTLCFVNSHLAAYDEMVDKRNLDYHELCRRLLFPLLAATPAEAATSPAASATIFDCDCLFWMVRSCFHSSLGILFNDLSGR
jgi:inositol polyphosphate 5-phosphatase INPP5B/F